MSVNSLIILGLHIGHDRCAAIVKEGKIVAAIAEERLDRIKYSPADTLPELSITAVLKMAKCPAKNISTVAVTFSGILIDEALLDIWRLEISQYLLIDEARIQFVGHHLAHAYAVYFTSPFDNAAIMIADGAGDMIDEYECEAESYYEANRSVINRVFVQPQQMPAKYGSPLSDFRHDYMVEHQKKLSIGIGRKYEQVTKLIGFQFGQAGKTMGLSPYGQPLIKDLPDTMGMAHTLTRHHYLRKIDSIRKQNNQTYKEFLKVHRADVAKDVQLMTEEMLLSCIKELSTKTQSNNLCLSGGVFLNCVANKKILDAGYFKQVYMMPACGDDGQAAGAALYIYHQVRNAHKPLDYFCPYLGLNYTNEDAINIAERVSLKHKQFQSEDALIELLANKLHIGQVFGVVRGRSELGPRALGNRSILASPLIESMKDHINKDIKYREDFRPFAPMVSAEAVSEFFEFEGESPYMLLTCMVREKYRDLLPAITHVDGSARVQTVSRQQNPFIHKLLTKFGEKTGFPILVNTSFNTAREPIVESPKDACRTLINSGLNGVIVENVWIERR